MLNHTLPLKGTVQIPGDKSISHRGIMFGSLSQGITEVSNFLMGADCLSTIQCFRKLGIEIHTSKENNSVIVHGKGLHGLRESMDELDVGNSGTTIRLISGILSGQNFTTAITGDSSIQKRPMNRIITPLEMMGANIESKDDKGLAPLIIHGTKKGGRQRLQGIHYQSPVASAQIKSCILLAGLYGDSPSSVTEPFLSRNHTELMLRAFGANISSEGTTATVEPSPKLYGQKVEVPGDISSAAYFIAAALLVPNSEILIQNVGINPTRDGIIQVCKQMGGDITLQNIHQVSGEPVADLLVRHSELHGIEIGGDIIPTLIDEIPIIAVLACFAKGTTIIKDAAELKVKESNRIDIMVQNLSNMGANIEGTDDGMIIEGGRPLTAATITTKADHRIAMSFTIAALMTEDEVTITDPRCVEISYPNFYQDLKRLQRQ